MKEKLCPIDLQENEWEVIDDDFSLNDWVATREALISRVEALVSSLKRSQSICNVMRVSGTLFSITGLSLVLSELAKSYVLNGTLFAAFMSPVAITLSGCGTILNIVSIFHSSQREQVVMSDIKRHLLQDMEITLKLQDRLSLVFSALSLTNDAKELIGKTTPVLVSGSIFSPHHHSLVPKLIANMPIHRTVLWISLIVDIVELIEAGQNLNKGSHMVLQLEFILSNMKEELNIIKTKHCL